MLLSNWMSSPIKEESENILKTVSQLELEMLAAYGLKSDSPFPVKIYECELPGCSSFLHTIQIGNPSGPTVVMMHGYGSSASFYSSMVASLL